MLAGWLWQEVVLPIEATIAPLMRDRTVLAMLLLAIFCVAANLKGKPREGSNRNRERSE